MTTDTHNDRPVDTHNDSPVDARAPAQPTTRTRTHGDSPAQHAYLPLASLRMLVGARDPKRTTDPAERGAAMLADLGRAQPEPYTCGIPLDELKAMYAAVWSAHTVSVGRSMPCRDAYVVASKNIPQPARKASRGPDLVASESSNNPERARLLATVAVHLLHPNFNHGEVLNLAVIWLTATLLSAPDLTLEKLDTWVQHGPARIGGEPNMPLTDDAHKDAPGAVRVRTLLRAMVDAGVWPQLAVDMISEALRVGLIERVSSGGDTEVFPTADWICLGRGGVHRILEVCVCGFAPDRQTVFEREERLGKGIILPRS